MPSDADANSHLQQLFEQASDILVVASADARVIQVNPAWERELGLSAEESVGMPFSKLVPEEDMPRIAEAMAQLNAGSPLVSFVARCNHRDGHTLQIEWNVRARDGYYYGCGRNVTQRLAEQRELHEARQRYEQLARLAPVGIFLSDQQGNIQFSNERMAEIGGHDEASYAGHGWMQVLHPDDRARVEAAMWKAVSTGGGFDEEYRVKRPDGTTRWVHTRVEPARNSLGAITSYVGVVEDVTERVDTISRLRAAREQYETLARLAPVGIYMTDSQANGVFANRRLEEMSGLSEGQSRGQGWMSIIHPDDLPRLLQEWQSCAAEGRTFSMEHRLRRTDGTVRWVRQSSEPFSDAEGKLEGFIGVIDDITERKQAADEVKAARELYEALARLAPVGIVMTDADGTPIYGNERLAEVMGIRIDQVLAGDWVRALHPEDRRRVVESWQEACRKCIEFADSYRLVHPDGTVRWVEARVRPLPTGEGSCAGFVGVIEDITDRKRLHDMLEDTNRELEEFTYAASHDLREPLRTIASFCELLEIDLREGNTSAVAEDLGIVTSAARRMQGLVRELLVLSRSSKQKLHIQATPLEICFTQATQDLTSLIESTGAVVIAQDLPVAMADPEHITRVFQNFISNAIKYQPPGGKARVQVYAQSNEGEIKVFIQDNGIGIAPEHHDKLFTAFKRLHSRDQYEGFGIGLAICKRTIERHGGSVGMHSAPGAGSTFWFTLRAAPTGEQR